MPLPADRTRRLALVASAALLLAARPAHAQVTRVTQAKMLADPAYKAYEDKRSALLRSGLRGEARSRALRALDDANRAVLQKAYSAAGLGGLLSNTVRLLPEGSFGPGFTMDGDTRVYAPPFASRVANSGDASLDGHVVAQSDTFTSGAMAQNTYRTYVGVNITVPANAIGMAASVEVDVSDAAVETNAGLTGARARAGVVLQAAGALPGDGFFDVWLMQQDADAGTHDHWTAYTKKGLKTVSSTVVPVTPGGIARVGGGVTAWVDSNWDSHAFASASGNLRAIRVKFIYAAAPTPTPQPLQAYVLTPTPLQAFVLTPTLPPAMALPTPAPGLAQKFLTAPADIALSALPPGSGWPSELVVKNLAGKTSESTLVRAKVVLTQGDLDVVAQNCHPRFVDFDEAVPALAPGQSATIGLQAKIGTEALASWTAVNKPAARSRPVKTPTPNPVQTFVVCRYALTASLGQNQNLGDPNKKNNVLTRDIVENVPLK
jgi:hypothetical protein